MDPLASCRVRDSVRVRDGHADCGMQISKQEYKVGKKHIVSPFHFPSQNKEGTKHWAALFGVIGTFIVHVKYAAGTAFVKCAAGTAFTKAQPARLF